MKNYTLCFIILLSILAGGCMDLEKAAEGETEMSFQITSSAFKEGENIPRMYTCDDQNISLPVAWSGIPENTKSLAVIMDDPDAPAGTWVHWVLFNLKPDLTELKEGDTGGGNEGKNGFNRTGYGGPCPPKGSTHRYFWTVYARDRMLDLKEGATKAQVEEQMRGHILAQGQYMGRYGR
jgi:Raf kinase inhibitor-like YbhB/YbcL family protein